MEQVKLFNIYDLVRNYYYMMHNTVSSLATYLHTKSFLSLRLVCETCKICNQVTIVSEQRGACRGAMYGHCMGIYGLFPGCTGWKLSPIHLSPN